MVLPVGPAVLLLYHFLCSVLSYALILPSDWIFPLSWLSNLETLLMETYSDKFFPFQFSGYVLILSSFLKTSLAGCPIPGSEFVFSVLFSPFKQLDFFTGFWSHTAGEKSAAILICVSCRYSSFLYGCFKVFFLSWLSCSMTMCITLDLSLFIWIRIHWVSRTWWFACFMNSRKALVNLYVE